MSVFYSSDNEPEVTNRKGAVVAARSVKDPIHDMIPLSPRLCMFIDTKQFQRLRNIKQLGTSYYIWLGASHSRFEHCIGVAFLARSMATHLKDKQPELGITDRDIECVEVAGLCHDLGHGPWSHVWDGLFIPKALPGRSWKHEDASVMMFDALVRENEIPMKAEDEAFIKALISGDPSQCSADEKPFLFDIVANRRNGLDVDKFDYIPRDSHMVGDKMNIALMRIINSARVLDDQICYDIKDANLIYEICATRFKLHKMIYSHKAAKAIEYMIIDGLLAAEPHLKIANRVDDPRKYLYLTDDIMGRIEESTDPELAKSRAIFDRIRTRDLYKMVDYKVVDWPWAEIFQNNITPEGIVEAARELSEEDPSIRELVKTLSVEHVICDFSLMHYGMKEKNPLDFVKFYSKRHPNEPSHAERGVYSNLMPQFFAELLVRIFTRDVDYFGVIQAGYRRCLQKLPSQINDPTPDQLVLEPMFPITPPVQTFSRVSSFSRPGHGLGRGGGGGGGGGSTTDPTPFSNNNFTTVDMSFAPPSPSRKAKRRRVD
ncbi:SAM domain and HD domain-containing protein 1 [Termitomyces sp. J132]|nr:SAM domain and HD domain-containing protein 1 [Termitomyces sp. J132]